MRAAVLGTNHATHAIHATRDRTRLDFEPAPASARNSRSSRLMRRLAQLSLLLLASCASSNMASGGTTPAPDPLQTVPADQLFAHGEQLAAQGDAVRAEQYLSAAMQRGFPAQRVLPLLLRVCLVSSRLGAALQYAAPYLQLHPEDHHLRYLVATVQLGLSRTHEAQRELQRILREAPDYADAHYLLGVILRDYEHDAVAAAAQFQRHQELDPSGLHALEVAAWLREHAELSTPARFGEAPAADGGGPVLIPMPAEASP
jgi:tetratricopeptide (TPR) repeat protein